MRRGLRVAVWVAAILVSAGVGAVVAAHSNPFPPGVEDPGSQSAVTPTPTQQTRQSWVMSLRSETSHQLFVGGRCTTYWSGHLLITADQQEHLQGTGQVQLVGRLVCDFANAQLQVRKINVFLQGQRYGERFLLRLAENGRVPAGSRDYGGFTNTVFDRPFRIVVHGGHGSATIQLTRADDTGRGRFVSSTRFTIRCSTGCG